MKNLKVFEDYSAPEVSVIESEDVPKIVDILHSSFGHIDSKETIASKLLPRMLNGISIKLTVNGEIVGCYILATKSVNAFISDIKSNNLKDFKSGNTQLYLKEEMSDRGLQGIALSIMPEWRSYGYGNLLKNWYSGDPRFDYIWGVQDKNLGNIEDWKKTREIFAECPTHFATIRKFVKSEPIYK
jgi:hypothetical protein